MGAKTTRGVSGESNAPRIDEERAQERDLRPGE